MGVAIHYRGRLGGGSDAQRLFRAASAEAERRGWRCNESTGSPGIVVLAHERCDPIEFQPGEDLLIDSFVKTQFAGPDVHAGVAQFLQSLAPHFAEWDVEDEGEFYETSDRDLLAQHMTAFDKALEEHLNNNPGARGPVRLPSGRWVDVME
jgi:hypothetical protein